MVPPGIEAKQLELRIAGRTAFSIDHLDLAPGHWLHVWGEVGAGQSWIVKVMSGAIPFLEPGEVTGEISWFGCPRREVTLSGLGRLVGYVGTDPIDHLVALRVGDEMRWASSLTSEKNSAAVREFLRFAEVEELGMRETRTLSSGQRQRVSLASCFASNPKAIMLVDAYTTLDERTRVHLNRFAERFTQEDKGILVLGDQDPPPQDAVGCTCLTMHGGKVMRNASTVCSSSKRKDIAEAVESFRGALEQSRRAKPGNHLRLGRAKVVADHGLRLDVNGFELSPGQSVGLVGSNGAGKTTLLEVLAQLIRIPRGERCKAGRMGNVWGAADSGVSLAKLGAVALVSPFGEGDADSVRAWDRFRWLWLCARAGVDHLVLDEPAIGFDRQHRNLMIQILQQFLQAGCSIVIASHDLELLDASTERAIWLSNGRQIAEGRTARILAEYREASETDE